MTDAIKQITALVLAGERPGGDPFAREMGVSHKSLIEVGGKPILTQVLAALDEAGFVRIAVCTGNEDVKALAQTLGAQIVPAESGPSASVLAAFERFGAPMLVTTSDHALLRSEWMRDFVSEAPTESDVAILLAKREAVEAALPGTRRTYLRFADGAWSGCNLFLLRTAAAGNALGLWSEVEANRKRPWRIAMQLGPGMLRGYLLGRMKLRDAVARLGRRAGIEARVVAARDGLAAVDVDKAADLAQVRAVIERRA